MPAGQLWGTANLGGNLTVNVLSKKLHDTAQPLMKGDQFATIEPAAGKGRGDTVYFVKPSNVAAAGGAIAETTPIPITNITVPRGSVVLGEYANGISFTAKLESLSEIEIERLLIQPLRNDAAKTLNVRAIAEFKKTYVMETPTGTIAVPTATYDTDGTISTAATRDVQAFDVYDIVEYMKGTLYTPPYDGNNYVAICHAGFLRKLREDGDWQDAAKFGDPERLFAGEIGRFNGVRFVEDNHQMNKVLGTSTYKGEAVFFGDDAILKAVAVPLEVREKIPADFGRDKAYAWYWLGEYAIIWSATAVAGEGRVVFVTAT